MEFDQRKSSTLSKLFSSETDNSLKGTVDTAIIPLLQAVNSHPCYFTTSSCSGRISILSYPNATGNHVYESFNNKKKACGGSWIFLTHDMADPSSVIKCLFSNSHRSTDVVLRFEPMILSVECKDLEAANFLVSLAISSGFRESGVTVSSKGRVIAGIRCSIRMEVPLGDTDSILVSREYSKFLVHVANQKMKDNWKRTCAFLSCLSKNGFLGNNIPRNCDSRECKTDSLERHIESNRSGEKIKACLCKITQIPVFGEPVQNIFLWGHSACTLDCNGNSNIFVFGGFGGMGRHSRRNETLLLDPSSGRLEAIHAENAPYPRLGHTMSIVGDSAFVIGGRADPFSILNDVWMLNLYRKEWRKAQYNGHFPGRHRHAAAVIGSDIYVFGGVNNDTIFSSLHVLNTENLQWKEIEAVGRKPCARHSHSLVAHEHKLFVFGGYDGEQPLGDLFSFDTKCSVWKEERISGRGPHARFSHSAIVFKEYIVVIGGCPSKHNHELAILDLRAFSWIYVTTHGVAKQLLPRSTASVTHDAVVLIGGGASCYAFGTKFNSPLRIGLPYFMVKSDDLLEIKTSHLSDQNNILGNECNLSADSSLNWVLKVEKNYAKLSKDLLKKYGWLDLSKKVCRYDDELHVYLPVTKTFCKAFGELQQKCQDEIDQKCFDASDPYSDGFTVIGFPEVKAMLFLRNIAGIHIMDNKMIKLKRMKSPLEKMRDAVAVLISHKGLSTVLLNQLPTRWQLLGDMAVLPAKSFSDPVWNFLGTDLWLIISGVLGCNRIARQERVAAVGTRDSQMELLWGENGWVQHQENGVLYAFDATKCMFSWGNLSERHRMAQMDCRDEVIVDMYAGIGYFVLPFLVRAKARLVYACEWNSYAIDALKHNLDVNGVSTSCIVLEGDNRDRAPNGVADRVCLGLLPSSESGWAVAVRALRNEGGMLHIHGAVRDSEEESWKVHVARSISEISASLGHDWDVSVKHVERVKWYAPHIRHLVADVRCILYGNSVSALQR